MTIAIAVIKVAANYISNTRKLLAVSFFFFLMNLLFFHGFAITSIFKFSTQKFEVPASSLKATGF